jgi:hypothetical membrane protein
LKNSAKYVIASALACIIVSIGEFVTIFAFGKKYPGYSHLKDTMSQLGASASPVSMEISIWWIIMGLLMVFFATGLQKAFEEKGRYARFASFLIILYGIGEGIGSAVFKADHTVGGLTTSAIIHNFVGSIGVIAILLLPLVMQKVTTRIKMPVFHRMSKIFFSTGIFTVFLFLFRYSTNENSVITIYKGLWQRLFMLNTYGYLTAIAFIMIKEQLKIIIASKGR